ncbi:MAG: hypothetical protein HYX69_01470 [Planctomycetia bacterium]|nr:hypothetical protein [Planctomycetia bacterium]
MIRQMATTGLVVGVLGCAAAAADYKVAAIEQGPPDDVAADVAKQLAPSGFKVTSGSRTTCEIWLRRAWPAVADFAPSQSVLYPFEMGELMGVIRFPRKANDFRGQEIAAGVYTLRYGQQPVDGNHVGTSETRDFLVMAPAAKDTTPDRLDKEELFKRSKEASETTHPAILTMLAVPAGAEALPAMVHDEARELWSVVLKGSAAANGKMAERVIDFVVVGQAAE